MFNKQSNKMNKKQSFFTIKDLEHITGIKAHTIRIWEKRYQILHPARSNNNIRIYDQDNLKKLFNIAVAVEAGNKISRLAQLPLSTLETLAATHLSEKNDIAPIEQRLRIALITYNELEFEAIIEMLVSEKAFPLVYLDTIVPFINNISNLWHTNSISSCQEAFIFNLLHQKLVFYTETCNKPTHIKNNEQYILFGEISPQHQLDLAFINYILRTAGYNTINLTNSFSLENLKEVKKHFSSVVFVTVLTDNRIANAISQSSKTMHQTLQSKVLLITPFTTETDPNVTSFSSLREFYNTITTHK